jgi:hypothetical protein
VKEAEKEGSCSMHGKDEKRIQTLVGKPKWKRPLGRLEWENNIKMCLEETG